MGDKKRKSVVSRYCKGPTIGLGHPSAGNIRRLSRPQVNKELRKTSLKTSTSALATEDTWPVVMDSETIDAGAHDELMEDLVHKGETALPISNDGSEWVDIASIIEDNLGKKSVRNTFSLFIFPGLIVKTESTEGRGPGETESRTKSNNSKPKLNVYPKRIWSGVRNPGRCWRKTAAVG